MAETNDQTEVRAIYESASRNPKFQSCVDLVEATAREHSLPFAEIDTQVKMLIHLLRLAQHTGTPPEELERLAGKSVLDIACGRQINHVTMQPWFCRLAHKLGCKVTGVDLPHEPELTASGLDDEVHAPWNFVGMDLRDPARLARFPDSSVEIVHSTYFIFNETPKDDCPVFAESLPLSMEAIAIPGRIVDQMQRIVKPEGVIILNDSSFDKAGRPNPKRRR